MHRVLSLAAAVLFAAPALAQDLPDSSSQRPIKYTLRTVIELEGISLKGELVGPRVQVFDIRDSTLFNPLISIRSDFNQQLRRSVDVIR